MNWLPNYTTKVKWSRTVLKKKLCAFVWSAGNKGEKYGWHHDSCCKRQTRNRYSRRRYRQKPPNRGRRKGKRQYQLWTWFSASIKSTHIDNHLIVDITIVVIRSGGVTAHTNMTPSPHYHHVCLLSRTTIYICWEPGVNWKHRGSLWPKISRKRIWHSTKS